MFPKSTPKILSFFIGLCLIAIGVGTVGAGEPAGSQNAPTPDEAHSRGDSDSNPEAFVTWINDYPEDSYDREHSDEDAKGFADQLMWAWTEESNSVVWETDFKKESKGGHENDYVDAHDLVYFSGATKVRNGRQSLFFSGENDYRYLIPGHDCENSWGDQDVEWVAFNAPITMEARGDYWHDCFWHMHLALGWVEASHDVDLGSYFGNFLVKNGDEDTAMKLLPAWFDAGDHSENPNGIEMLVKGANESMGEDYVHGQGDVQPDPGGSGPGYRWEHTTGSSAARGADRRSLEDPGLIRVPARSSRGFSVSYDPAVCDGLPSTLPVFPVLPLALDGLGELDLIAGNLLERNRLYLNDGTPSGWTAGSDVTTDAHPTYAVALGDVDRDGDLDLIAGNGGVNRLYLNTGTAAPWIQGSDITSDSAPTRSIVLGDVDLDRDLDLVVGNYGQANRLYLNDGSSDPWAGVAGLNVDDGTDSTSSLALGDVDGDGDPDLIVGNDGAFNRLYRNQCAEPGTCDGTTSPWQGAAPETIESVDDPTSSVALGDLDGDGDLDLVVGNRGGTNRRYLNDGGGSFGGGSSISSDTHNTNSVSLGDVDGDGDLDLIAGNENANRLYLNDGSANFDGGADIGSDTADTWSVALADVDEDGDLDLVAGNAGPNLLYLNGGSGNFAPGSDITSDAHTTRSVVLGDVDTNYVRSIAEAIRTALGPDRMDPPESAIGQDGIGFHVMSDADGDLLRVSPITGAVNLIDTGAWMSLPATTPQLPGVAQAESLADTFLLNVGRAPDSYGTMHRWFTGTATDPATGEDLSTEIYNIEIIYLRLLFGLPVAGPGGKIAVVFGHDDHVERWSERGWRSVGPGVPGSLRSCEDALSDLTTYGQAATIDGITVPADEILVDAVSPGYYEHDDRVQQQAIEPIYIIDATLDPGTLAETSFTIHVEAQSRPLIASITLPGEESYFEPDTEITFQASADFGIPPYDFEWWSDLDGSIGKGSSIAVTPGVWSKEEQVLDHSITVEVTDAAGATSSSVVRVSFGAGTLDPANLRLDKASGGQITLDWSTAPSCSTAASDYGIYEGDLGVWYNHDQITCTDTSGNLAETIVPSSGGRYYLVIPNNPSAEGSYGRGPLGAQRPVGITSCAALQAIGCP